MRHAVVVVGLGAMGAATLCHLARRGTDVVGVDVHGVGNDRGSSWGQTRVIRKAYFEHPSYVPLLHRAYALWAELAAEVGVPLQVRAGCLTFGPPDHPALIGVGESVAAHRLPHERLDATAIARRFPAFVPAAADVGVYEDDGGYLFVERCTRAHVDVAVAHGARVVVDAVVGVDVDDHTKDGAVRVALAGGEVIVADRVVVAAGGAVASDPVFAPFVARVPLHVQRQPQLWWQAPASSTSFATGALPCFVHFTGRGAFYGIPVVDGDDLRHVKVCRHGGGARTTTAALDRGVHAVDVDDVRAHLRAHLPALDGPVARGHICQYTLTPDEHFVVDHVDASLRVLLLSPCSGHGAKMASVVGEVAADLVTGVVPAVDIGLFGVSRFS